MKFTLIKLSINQSLTRLLIKFYKKICYKTSLKINKIILGLVSSVLRFYNLLPLPVASMSPILDRNVHLRLNEAEQVTQRFSSGFVS